MIKIKNKKAAIGATITWVVATLIIIFLIFIFIGVIGIKKVAGDKTPEVKIDSLGKNNLFLAESFYGFLNKQVDEETVRSLTYRWADGLEDRDVIEKQFQNFVTNLDFNCSIADVNSERGKIRVVKPTDYSPVYSTYHQELFLEKGINLTLISDKNNLIKINIYAGECKDPRS